MADPLGGSYFVEALTDAIEARIIEIMEDLDEHGGMVQAIEDGYLQGLIADEAYRLHLAIEAGERPVVGVNRFVTDEPAPDLATYEVAIVAEEFGCRLVDVLFLGPVLADDLRRRATGDLCRGADRGHPWTVAVDGEAMDARGAERVLTLSGNRLLAGRVGADLPGADLTRRSAEVLGPLERPVSCPAPMPGAGWR